MVSRRLKRLDEVTLLRAERERERADLRRAVTAAEAHECRARIGILTGKIDALLTGRTLDASRVVWLGRR